MSERYSVIYTKSALEDLRSIYSYIAGEYGDEDAAAKRVRKIRIAIRTLDMFSGRYPCHRDTSLHIMPAGRYRVIYVIDDEKKTAGIRRIFASRQNIGYLLKREQ